MRIQTNAPQFLPSVFPRWVTALTVGVFLGLACDLTLYADTTWNYAVQICATAQVFPPQIQLTWPQDNYGAIRYTVYRKTKEATSWGTGIQLSGATTNFTDANVVVGQTYEYQIIKDATLGYKGYGYIFSGIQAPLVEDRGKLVLIVENRHAAALSNELVRLQNDLTGDGWTVIRHDVSTNDTPASVRSLIVADYLADPAHVTAVFLFGHVPILHSGNLNYDGHLARPMPADAYYGDVDGNWNNSLDYLPSDVELMVGRVDMFDMPGNYASVPWPSEVELLRNYLNKDHNWRHKLVSVPRRALMGDRRGAENGLATSVSGFRNFDPLLGHGTTTLANIDDTPNAPNLRWGPLLNTDAYLWAYGCGAGSPSGIASLGTNGQYYDLRSIDVVAGDAKAVFVMLFGSWFGNWDGTDNFMRSFLATPSLGLTCCMAGVPHWFVHHMGLGETIGYGTRLSMNNQTLYQSQSNRFPRAVYISLMGDPTLRMDPVATPGPLNFSTGSQGVTLSWSSSVDAVIGYQVYRKSIAANSFSRLTTSPITGNSFTDSNVASGNYTYMVRAVKLETTASGTYSNASQGVFGNFEVGNSPPPIRLTASRMTNGLLLGWNAQSGSVYRVLAKTNISQSAWADVSGALSATGTTALWLDTNINSIPRRFHQVVRPE